MNRVHSSRLDFFQTKLWIFLFVLDEEYVVGTQWVSLEASQQMF